MLSTRWLWQILLGEATYSKSNESIKGRARMKGCFLHQHTRHYLMINWVKISDLREETLSLSNAMHMCWTRSLSCLHQWPAVSSGNQRPVILCRSLYAGILLTFASLICMNSKHQLSKSAFRESRGRDKGLASKGVCTKPNWQSEFELRNPHSGGRELTWQVGLWPSLAHAPTKKREQWLSMTQGSGRTLYNMRS